MSLFSSFKLPFSVPSFSSIYPRIPSREVVQECARSFFSRIDRNTGFAIVAGVGAFIWATRKIINLRNELTGLRNRVSALGVGFLTPADLVRMRLADARVTALGGLDALPTTAAELGRWRAAAALPATTGGVGTRFIFIRRARVVETGGTADAGAEPPRTLTGLRDGRPLLAGGGAAAGSRRAYSGGPAAAPRR